MSFPDPILVRSARRAFTCQCGRPVFFLNDVCLACKTPLGYDPELVLIRPLQATDATDDLVALPVAGDDAAAPLSTYRRCANTATAAGCNWLVPQAQAAAGERFCRSCRVVRTIPDADDRDNAELWNKVEVAKRALIAQLISLGLPVASKIDRDPARGVMFDLLRAPPGAPHVMTGHDDGVITLDIEEADDVHRETMRQRLHEPYRTLVGHLRHEIGHYYWQRLVEGSAWEAPCREVFGDERLDYPQALAAYYANGAPTDWQDRHVSEYASSHAYEDWAETWAHYLHIVDAFATARSFGLVANASALPYDAFGPDALDLNGAPAGDADLAFLATVNGWIELTLAFNQVTRSMGEPDFYPFVISVPAVKKLHFIHKVVEAARADAGAGYPAA